MIPHFLQSKNFEQQKEPSAYQRVLQAARYGGTLQLIARTAKVSESFAQTVIDQYKQNAEMSFLPIRQSTHCSQSTHKNTPSFISLSCSSCPLSYSQ